MREQAYRTTTHPDLEELAAFIDCTLPAEDRARVMAHLAHCEDCYTVFSETVHLQQQESEPSSSQGRGVLPFPLGSTKPFWRRGVALAALPMAAALLAVVGFSVYQNVGPAPEMRAADLVGSLRGRIEPTRDLWQLETFRGEGEVEMLLSPRETFQLGVALVHLQAALQAGNVEQASDALSRVNKLLEHEDFIDQEKEYYTRAVGDLYLSATRSQVLRQLRESSPTHEARLDESFDSPYLPFGKWSEAGRLSALAGSPEFFETRANRRFPRWLRRAVAKPGNEDLDPEITAALDVLGRIESQWSTGTTGRPSKELTTAFAKILRFYAGGGEPDRHAPASSSSAR